MGRRKFKDGEKVHFKKDKLIYNGKVVGYNGSLKKPYLVEAGVFSLAKRYTINYRLKVEDLRKGYYDVRY